MKLQLTERSRGEGMLRRVNKKLCLEYLKITNYSEGSVLQIIHLQWKMFFFLSAESINRAFMISSPYKYLTKLNKCSIGCVLASLWLLPAIIIVLVPIPLYGAEWRLHMYFQLEMFACSQTSSGHPAADGNSSYGRWVTRFLVFFQYLIGMKKSAESDFGPLTNNFKSFVFYCYH